MHYPASDLVIDPVLIRRYDVSGPRYTSYPTADRFVEAFGESDLRQWLAKRGIGGASQPLSLYVHLPRLSQGRDARQRSSQYIKYLERELALLAPSLGSAPEVDQLHWGGGTPAFLAPEEMRALAAAIARHFRRASDCDCVVEIDPRRAAPGTLELLAALGFNRVSLGVQSEAETRRVVGEARACAFRSVNVDLVYGLPKQTLDGFNRTLDQVIALDPDRIALTSYAHAPSAEAKLQILSLAIGRLTRAGYLYIGMDHFARPDDELALAQSQGRLQRNLQGYSTRRGSDLIGLGVSATGAVGPTYAQNQKRLEDYTAALDAGRLPVARGLELTQDDLLRRAVIHGLACHFRLSIESVELAHLVDFGRYFAPELEHLRRLEAEGLVELQPDWIVVTPKGRLLVRVVCAVFDRYLRERRARAEFAKVI